MYIYIFPGAQGDVLASTVMRSHDFNSFKKKKSDKAEALRIYSHINMKYLR